MQSSIAHIPICKVYENTASNVVDDIAVEEPLEIRLEYCVQDSRVQKIVSVTMRTPGNDEALAAGFLFTEGIIYTKDEMESVLCTENNVLVKLVENVRPHLQQAERNFYTTSSCGVCGKASIDAIKTVSPYHNIADTICISVKVLYQLADSLANQQAIFQATGGLHASALFDVNGNFLFLKEDVGRHNALDKVIGAAFLQGLLPLSNCILLLSGRASFELIQKAAMAGIKVVAAVGAPSSLAIQLAEETGITLAGFLRNKRFNIYFDKGRIDLH